MHFDAWNGDHDNSGPSHRLSLTCGEVKVGVHPALPVEGVDLILVNDLAGTKAWADSVPPLVVTRLPVLQPQQEGVKPEAKGEPDVGLFRSDSSS